MGIHRPAKSRRRRVAPWLLVALGLFAVHPAAAFWPFSGAASSPGEGQQQAEEEPESEPEPPPEPPPAPATDEARVAELPPPREPVPEAGELFVEFKYAVNGTDIKGNEERSFLHEGVNHIVDFSTFSQRPLLGGRVWESLGVFRYTDDPRVDPEVNSLQRFYTRLAGPTFEFTAGDHLVNYSRFSFNQNIKGLRAAKSFEELGGFTLTGTAGVFTDRWGSLYKGFEEFVDPRTEPDPRFPQKPFTRMVLGFRGEKPFGENKFIAFNYSQGSDIIRSLPRQVELPPFNNQLWSFDGVYLFTRNIRLAGELAFSASQFDARFQDGKRGDWATRLELSQQWRWYRWRIEYNRFEPNFLSVNARQVQDLQDVSLQGTIDFTDNVALTGRFRRTNDNLGGEPVLAFIPRRVCNDTQVVFRPQPLSNDNRTRTVCDPVTGDFIGLRFFDHVVDAAGNEMTTTLTLPEVRLALRRFSFWPRLVVELGYRERRLETSNGGSFRATTETSPATGESVSFLTPLFRERTTKSPFAEFSFALADLHQFRFAYEYRRNRDRVVPGDSTFTHHVALQYRLPSLFIGEWTLSGNIRFETDRESKQVELETLEDPVSGLTLVDPDTLRPLVRRRSAGDQTRTLQGNFILDFPKYFTLEVYYRELSADLLSAFLDQGIRRFSNGGFRRPRGRVQLQYRINNDENKFILFTIERSVNTFNAVDPAEPDTRSFREKLAQVSFVYRFRR